MRSEFGFSSSHTGSLPRVSPSTQVMTGSALDIWRRFDLWLFGSSLLLILIGILFIRSATLGAVDTDLIGRVQSQILYTFLGVIVMGMMATIDYRLLGALQHYIYGFLVFALALVGIAGQVGGAGAQRWLNVGIPIQPSEIGKMLIIIALGAHLSKQYTKLDQFRTVIVSLIYMALPMLLIFIQPNLGNVIVFTVIWGVMTWGAGLRIKHIAMLMMIGLSLLPMLWVNMEDYQKGRILTFINPEGDKDSQYNVDQSLISVGSGGLLGRGYANGSQTQGRFLRVRHTDFIFSVIAHESGFIGAATVLGLILFTVFRILRAAALARDELGSLICYGVAAVIFFQTVTAVGMNLVILPVTGLTLPFVSSGGTSLLALLFGIGLVQSVVMRRIDSALQ